MREFIKRNVKTIIISGVSLFIIAGLCVALIATNVGTANARGRDRSGGRNSERVHTRVELTEEQIAERIAERIQRLEQRLEDGKITQEEYDEKMAILESGEYLASDKLRTGNKRNKNGS